MCCSIKYWCLCGVKWELDLSTGSCHVISNMDFIMIEISHFNWAQNLSYINMYFILNLFNNVIGAMSKWASKLCSIIMYCNYNSQGTLPLQQSVVIGETVRARTMLHPHVFYTESQKHVLCIYFHTLPTIQQC